MKRKQKVSVVKLSPTYRVTLPRKVVKLLGLKKGDSLELIADVVKCVSADVATVLLTKRAPK